MSSRLYIQRLSRSAYASSNNPRYRTTSWRESYSTTSDLNANLPQQIDLLETYRGLVALGRIKYDEEQIRVVMQLRRLQKELLDYSPPAAALNLLNFNDPSKHHQDWWSPTEREANVGPEMKALVRRKSHDEELAGLETPKGLLLTGAPGSGKSFLVDLWFSSLPTPYKARKHYNQLVLEIYRAVWEETKRRMAYANSAQMYEEPRSNETWNKYIRAQWRELVKSGSLPPVWTRSTTFLSSPTPDPTIAFTVAKRLVCNHWLLVFDEIQLLDVSSAMLLADVLSWYWRMGGVIVGTSNKVPDDLYKNGVQRERLEPFVEALKVRCPVLTMRSEHDWRKVRGGDGVGRTWFKYGQEKAFEDKLRDFARGDSELAVSEPTPHLLSVFGRKLRVPWSLGGVCKFAFHELCDKTLGPADYLTLASSYHTIVITSIPILKLAAKDQARRFISLIDALYEARCRIVCLAECEPEQLFFPDGNVGAVKIAGDSAGDVVMDMMMAESVAETQDQYRPNVSSYAAPSMAEAPIAPSSFMPLDTLSIFSGQDEQFAFKRALSRLIEMSSASYGTDERWTPLPSSSRKWERSDVADLNQPIIDRAWPAVEGRVDVPGDDYAGEAAYVGLRGQIERPAPPSLSENHVWGVREDWGKGAKSWGRGAKAFEGPVSRS